MSQWSIQQWASLVSVLVVAVTAIAFYAKVSYRVEDLKEKVSKLDDECAKHRANHTLHRGEDFERWLSERFDGFDDKLDDIRESIKHQTQRRSNQ